MGNSASLAKGRTAKTAEDAGRHAQRSTVTDGLHQLDPKALHSSSTQHIPSRSIPMNVFCCLCDAVEHPSEDQRVQRVDAIPISKPGDTNRIEVCEIPALLAINSSDGPERFLSCHRHGNRSGQTPTASARCGILQPPSDLRQGEAPLTGFSSRFGVDSVGQRDRERYRNGPKRAENQ